MAQIGAEWLRRIEWSLNETATLFAGIDPLVTPRDTDDDEWRARLRSRDHHYANLKSATDSDELTFQDSRTGHIADRRVRPWDAVQWAIARNDTIPDELRSIPEPTPKSKAADKSPTATEPHMSNKLLTLIQAARTFWKNATPDEPDTMKTNEVVAAWLRDHGYSRHLAKSAATIIRPKWAPTGRKPGEK